MILFISSVSHIFQIILIIVYVELSPTSSDALTITISQFLVTTAPAASVAQRVWDFQTSQITCYATHRYVSKVC